MIEYLKKITFNDVKPIGTHNYFIYITTNISKKVLYAGINNNLAKRLYEHREDSLSNKKHFAGKYKCFYLIYYERFQDVNQAIKREKEIKGWRREKKVQLINTFNQNWNFLNETLN